MRAERESSNTIVPMLRVGNAVLDALRPPDCVVRQERRGVRSEDSRQQKARIAAGFLLGQP
ncbi:hypothetical protein BVY11_14100 [Pseudomonas amygdali pv. morsprunorum]|nr:hypothetical protein BVY11_14100 [Pseudomonas amygdali pv. morsprunorum]